MSSENCSEKHKRNLFLIANAADKNSKSSRLILDDISNEDFLDEIDDIF